MTRAALAGADPFAATATMVPSSTTTSPSLRGAPVPSTMVALRMMRSCMGCLPYPSLDP
jgi:hypothetical protein